MAVDLPFVDEAPEAAAPLPLVADLFLLIFCQPFVAAAEDLEFSLLPVAAVTLLLLLLRFPGNPIFSRVSSIVFLV